MFFAFKEITTSALLEIQVSIPFSGRDSEMSFRRFTLGDAVIDSLGLYGYLEVGQEMLPGVAVEGVENGDVGKGGVVDAEVFEEGGFDARLVGIVAVDGAALVERDTGREDLEPKDGKECRDNDSQSYEIVFFHVK